jgi:hypothetical protein
MVFIHGIYFGSNEEINLAHNEGFLYELFKDTGLYKLSLSNNENSFIDDDDDDEEEEDEEDDDDEDGDDDDDESQDEEDDYEKEKTLMFEMKPDDFMKLNFKNADDDDDDDLAIARVAEINDLLTTSKIFNNKNSTFNFSLNSSFKTSNRFINSEKSSLNSLNKTKYCESYLNKNFAHVLSSKSGRNKTSGKKGSSSRRAKKLTPTGEVLAKINKWMNKTKEIIELRNQQLVNKKRIQF